MAVTKNPARRAGSRRRKIFGTVVGRRGIAYDGRLGSRWLDYSIAPEGTYPLAVNQLNEALDFLINHAADYRSDPNRIVLAGDSAGAQLASQLAVLTTNSDYADLLGITLSLKPSQLIGAVLHCRVYDLDAMAQLQGIGAWGLRTAFWAYTGTRDWSETYADTTMSSIDFVTADLPPRFISGGNGDA